MSYGERLARELATVGVRGRLRRRILTEVDDHFRSGGEEEAFGTPGEVANAFAAELGAEGARSAAGRVFAALAVAGAVYAAAFVSLSFAGDGFAGQPTAPLGDLASIAIVIAPQLAFVAGTLAFLRALRRRRQAVLPSAELAVVNRRTGIALAGGLTAMAAFALYAFETAGLAAWWTTFVYVGCGSAAVLLTAAGAPFVAVARLRPQVAGEAGDIFDDLPVARYGGDPWRLARRVAFLVFLITIAAGVATGDPFDGALRGLVEAALCLGGFRVLGRYLGLR